MIKNNYGLMRPIDDEEGQLQGVEIMTTREINKYFGKSTENEEKSPY